MRRKGAPAGHSQFTDERNMRLRYRNSTLMGLCAAMALALMAPVGASGVRTDAASLVESKSDVILAAGDRVIPILMEMTGVVPIIIAASTDPLRPGG